MGHIEATKELQASPEAVWATVSDTSKWDQWLTIHEKFMEEPPAELTVGSKLVAKVVMLGMANKIEWVVKSIDAPRSFEIAGTGMAGVTVAFTFTLEPSGDNTKLTLSGDFDGAMIKGALGKAVEKDGAEQLDTSLTKLEGLAAQAAV